jgi:hypothetical protein
MKTTHAFSTFSYLRDDIRVRGNRRERPDSDEIDAYYGG